jgi:hypothetical protein
MGATMRYTGTLVIEECCRCHIAFAMPADFQRQCTDAGPKMTFCCPVGHAQHYTVSEVNRLKDELAQAQRRADRAQTAARAARDQADAAERTTRAYKGHLTRTRKRIGNGTCPCCNRHFANVERHMHSQHPGYADAEAAQ